MSLEIKTFGDYLRFVRRLKKISLRDLEKATGISNAALSQMENNHTSPSLNNAITLAKYFGFSLDEIAGLETEETKDRT